MSRWIAALWLAGLLVGASLAPAQAQQGSDAATEAQAVVFLVKDPTGAPVRNANVQWVASPEGGPETMEADEAGQLKVQVKPGEYSFNITSPGFRMFRGDFRAKAGEPTQVIPVVLVVPHPYPYGDIEIRATPDTEEKEAFRLSVKVLGKDSKVELADLKAMPRKTVTVHNPHANADETYEGVELADVLAKYGAPLGKDLRGPALGYYVVATGSDGYKAVYALAEVDPSFHPGDVIVADTMAGKALDAHTGPLRLVSTEDKRPARGVRNLVSIEVHAAE
jgi:hypothetical protein